jgi:Tfp pilus assembly protein PilF
MNPAKLRQAAILVIASSLLILLLSQNVLSQAASPPDKPTGLGAAESHLGKGYDALKQDRYEVAVEEFRAALAIDPLRGCSPRSAVTIFAFKLFQF